MIRHKILLIALFLNLMAIQAQDKVDDEALWLKDFKSAQDSAQKYNKPILISFSGSDWCKPCIKLRTQLFETPAFMHFATNELVLVHADFPYHAKITKEQKLHNEKLAEQYNKEGAFPKIVMVGLDGKIIYTCGYLDYSPDQYISLLRSHIPAKK